jgi:hypothetical protein
MPVVVASTARDAATTYSEAAATLGADAERPGEVATTSVAESRAPVDVRTIDGEFVTWTSD